MDDVFGTVVFTENAKADLSSPSVIEGVVREVLSELINARTVQIDDGVDPVETINTIAIWMQSVFYGHEHMFKSTPWHCEGGLGHMIVYRHKFGGQAHDAVYRLTVQLTADFYGALAQFEADEIDEDQLHLQVDAIVRRYTEILTES